MSDLLSQWIRRCRPALEEAGFRVTVKERHPGGSRSLDLESDSVVGGICHWPETRFEFQFNSCETGEVLVLEERDFSSVEDLNAYVEALLRDRLPKA